MMQRLISVLLLLLLTSSLFGKGKWGFNIPGTPVNSNRYITTMEINKVLRILRRRGVKTQWSTPFNIRNINGVYLENRGLKKSWTGMNIYRMKRKTHIYIITE